MLVGLVQLIHRPLLPSNPPHLLLYRLQLLLLQLLVLLGARDLNFALEDLVGLLRPHHLHQPHPLLRVTCLDARIDLAEAEALL